MGVNVKLVSTGGCVSEASAGSAGSAAMTARRSRNKALTEFRAKLRCPHANMRLPPAARLLVIKSCGQRRLRRKLPAAGEDATIASLPGWSKSLWSLGAVEKLAHNSDSFSL